MASAARRVFARALRRPVRVLGITLLLTGAVIGFRLLKAPRYDATLHFRLGEGELTDPNYAPRPPRDIRQHIAMVALSRNKLEQIMRKHGRSSAWLARDRVAAIEDFREEIEIDVSRNYFIYDRNRDDAGRSAQVTITLSGIDAEQTRDMLHEIGEAILQDQTAQRSGPLREAHELFGEELTRAREREKALQETIGRLWDEAAAAEPGTAMQIHAHIATLEAQSKAAIDQMIELDRRAAAVAFSAGAERERLGLNFELFDESLTTFAPRLPLPQLALRSGIVFAFLLLLTASVVGAFDDRIYAPEDLVACGVPTFGALPRFPGDDAGSYRARVSPERA